MDQIAFEEKCKKIKTNTLSDLEEYYGDREEWDDVSTSYTKYAIFYQHSCDHLLTAALLFGVELYEFSQDYLCGTAKVVVNQDELKPHHHNLLMQYFLHRIVVALLLDNHIDKTFLQEASNYHGGGMDAYSYPNESEVIDELDNETILSIFVPQIIVNALLDHDYTSVIKHLDPAIKSREKIWMYAWRFLYALHCDKASSLDGDWKAIVLEWKACLIKSDFHAFSNAHFVLLYYLYCDASGTTFDIKDLSACVLSLEN